MNNKQKEEDRSSTTAGSNFEPIDTPQRELKLEEEQPTVDSKHLDDLDGKSSYNNDSVISFSGGVASIGGLEKKLLEEKLKVAEMKAQMFEMKAEKEKANAEKAEMKAQLFEMKAEKEKAEMKAEMLKSKLEVMMGMEEKKGAELGELRAQLQAMLLKTIEEEVPKSLKRMEEDARANKAKNLKKLVDDEFLKVWLATGAGQLRSVSLLRVASNNLDSIGGWAILDGRLKAVKTRSGCAGVRAEKPFPVAVVKPDGQLLYFFEVTVIAKDYNSWMMVGLCDANFPFNSTYVGNVIGSFSIDNNGAYYASGKSVSGHGKYGFTCRDVVGCGLLVLPAERRLFFTKNSEVWGKPILLGADDAKADLFPAVSAINTGHEVEFNFGADLAAKPFKYDLTQLNVVDV